MIPTWLLFLYQNEILTSNTAAPRAIIKLTNDLGKLYWLLRYDERWDSSDLELGQSP